MNSLERYRVQWTREAAVNTYTRAHDRHHSAELAARARFDWDTADQEHEAALWCLRAAEREAYNPLPEGLE